MGVLGPKSPIRGMGLHKDPYLVHSLVRLSLGEVGLLHQPVVAAAGAMH